MGGNDPVVFSVTDYEGVEVSCTQSRWTLKIDENHPELSERQADVCEAISDPELVLQDRDYPNRKHHIRVMSDGLYMKVVAKYEFDPETETVQASFVTAYRTNRLRNDDEVLYMRVRR